MDGRNGDVAGEQEGDETGDEIGGHTDLRMDFYVPPEGPQYDTPEAAVNLWGESYSYFSEETYSH